MAFKVFKLRFGQTEIQVNTISKQVYLRSTFARFGSRETFIYLHGFDVRSSTLNELKMFSQMDANFALFAVSYGRTR